MPTKKVILNGNTIIDLTDTTAVEEDVRSGQVFYKSNGARAVGTNTAVTPSGTINITDNGTYNVSQYASAEVSVSGGGSVDPYFGYISNQQQYNAGMYLFAYSNLSQSEIEEKFAGLSIMVYKLSGMFKGSKLEDISFLNDFAIPLPPGQQQERIRTAVTLIDLFSGCSYLTHAVIPSSWCSNMFYTSSANYFAIGSLEDMFGSCTKLESADISTLFFRPNTTVSAKGMFQNCRILQSVVFPQDLTLSDVSLMFNGCQAALNSINLTGIVTNPNTLLSAYRMFYNCRVLTEIVWPESFKLGSNVNVEQMFYNCHSITSIVYGGSKSAWRNYVDTPVNNLLNHANNITHTITVICQDGNLEYQFDTNTSVYTLVEQTTSVLRTGGYYVRDITPSTNEWFACYEDNSTLRMSSSINVDFSITQMAEPDQSGNIAYQLEQGSSTWSFVASPAGTITFTGTDPMGHTNETYVFTTDQNNNPLPDGRYNLVDGSSAGSAYLTLDNSTMQITDAESNVYSFNYGWNTITFNGLTYNVYRYGYFEESNIKSAYEFQQPHYIQDGYYEGSISGADLLINFNTAYNTAEMTSYINGEVQENVHLTYSRTNDDLIFYTEENGQTVQAGTGVVISDNEISLNFGSNVSVYHTQMFTTQDGTYYKTGGAEQLTFNAQQGTVTDGSGNTYVYPSVENNRFTLNGHHYKLIDNQTFYEEGTNYREMFFLNNPQYNVVNGQYDKSAGSASETYLIIDTANQTITDQNGNSYNYYLEGSNLLVFIKSGVQCSYGISDNGYTLIESASGSTYTFNGA